MAQNSPKKVLFLITKGNFGGAQRYVFDLATGLGADFEPVVLLGEGSALETRLKEKGVRVIKLESLQRNISLKKEAEVLFELLKIFKEERPDVIHLNSSKIGGLGAFAGRISKVKNIIFTAHGWAFNENRPGTQKLIIKFFIWLTIIFSHKTIAVSEQIKRDIENLPFVSKKIEVINNGTSEIEYKTKAEARKFLFPDAPKTATWIGTMSELHHIKGLSHMIRAMKSVLHQHKAVFVVMGEGEERKNLENLIRGEGVENFVKLVGYVENAPQYLKAFDIFTLTSLSEAMPLALLEAGMAGIPSIASDVGGIPEIIDDGKNGLLIEPRDILNLARAIDFLIEKKKERDLMGKNLKEKVQKEFIKEKTIQKTVALYEAIT